MSRISSWWHFKIDNTTGIWLTVLDSPHLGHTTVHVYRDMYVLTCKARLKVLTTDSCATCNHPCKPNVFPVLPVTAQKKHVRTIAFPTLPEDSLVQITQSE